MKPGRRHWIAALGAGACSLAVPGVLRAQSDKPLRIIVGFAPGGAADTVARLVGDGLRPSGRTAIIENKPGAGGRIAVDTLLGSPADGNTLLLTPTGNLTLFPHVYRKLRYGPKDLAPVAGVAEFSFGFAVNTSHPAKSLQEFLAMAKADPKEGAYGTPGAGTGMHFIGVLLGKKAQLPLTHIGYRGGSAALTDLLGNSLPAMITTTPFLLPMHKSDKLRILAVSSDTPLAAAPEIPTFKASGFPELTLNEQFVFVARVGTPPEVVQQLSSAIGNAITSESVSAALRKQDYEPRSVPADPLGQRLQEAYKRWGEIVKDSGYTPED